MRRGGPAWRGVEGGGANLQGAPTSAVSSPVAVATADGHELHARLWRPDRPRAVVCLVHGFGEHQGRYHHVARWLAAAGLAVLAYDQRGHGRSPGPRGLVRDYPQLMDDLARAAARAGALIPGLPLFLYGHSMGGGEVVHFVLRHGAEIPQLRGVVATSPWLRLTRPPSVALRAAAWAVARAWPTLGWWRPFERGVLSHDPAVDRAYFSDPYVHSRITAPLYRGVSVAGAWSLANARRLAHPLLLMHGTADTVTDMEASRALAREAPPGLARFEPWEGLYHELHNEPEGERVVQRAAVWICDQLELAGSSTSAAASATASAVTR